MEKTMYQVWKPSDLEPDAFRDVLIGPLASELLDAGIRGYRVAVSDTHARTAKFSIVTTKPQADAILSIWLNSAIPYRRTPIEEILASHVNRFNGFLVTESEPHIGTPPTPSEPGERLDGMNQITTLRVPHWIDWKHWLATWHHSHAFVGAGTQSIYGYRQNVVVRPLTLDAPKINAFVEENFPEQSMYDNAHYYDGEGAKMADWEKPLQIFFPEAKRIRENRTDLEHWEQNQLIMRESVKRFIDFGQEAHIPPKIDTIPYSDFVIESV